jgi:hypothetical protein
VRPTVDPLFPDLQRAGIDLPTLLERGADTLVARDQPGTVALADVLERARGALVRGAPMEVLAALDTGWDGAARTESGWYFRAAALTLLGLPGEADRVLQQAVGLSARTPALTFLLSVVHSALGQAPAARAALADALALRPGEPLLRAWDAVLHARTGDVGGAQARLATLTPGATADPILAWARQAIQRASAADQRAARVVEPGATPVSVPLQRAGPVADASTPALDPIEAALRRLGARLRSAGGDALRDDVRQLMQSLSATGNLHDAGRSERAHAVRLVLATLMPLLGRDGGLTATDAASARPRPGSAVPPLASALEAFADAEGSWRLTPAGTRGVAPDAHAPLRTGTPTVRQAVLEALLAGRASDATALLAQANASEGEGVLRVLRCLVEGASARDGSLPIDGEPMLAAPLSVVRDDGLLAPLRFGLVLLQGLSPRHEARAVQGGAPSEGSSRHAVGAVSRAGAGSGPGVDRSARDAGLAKRLGIACLALAALSLLMGQGMVALLLAGGASWLLLR